MDTIEVRQGRPADAGTITDFQVKMALESEGLELDRATVAEGVRAVFEDPSKGRYWVACEGERILGVMLAVPEWSDWRNATVLWIHSLYIVPEARRRGAFRKLFLNLKARAEESPDLAGLRLYVDKANRAAQTAYEALGMTREHYYLYEWLD